MGIYEKREDRFWGGVAYNITIVKLCLHHLSHEFTSDASEQAIKKRQDESSDKEKQSARAKKTSLDLIKKTLALVAELESNTQVVRETGVDQDIADMLPESPVTSHISFRTLLVKLMIIALEYWEQSTGKSKIDLAEQSKLWRVNVSNGQLRVYAMDRYLDIRKLPKAPRWHQVIKTAYFVLKKSKVELPLRDELKETLNSILEGKWS
ncbi:MAG: hypothetical protein V3T17_15585 [Pseudomonadales bacterium]